MEQEETTVGHDTARTAAAARIRRQLAPLVAAPLAQRTATQLEQALHELGPDLALMKDGTVA